MTQFRFVEQLPDLIDPSEYESDPKGRRVRLRLRCDENGVVILGDAARAASLEALLESMGVEEIEQMLCG